MTVRRNEIVPFIAHGRRSIPIAEVLAVPLTAAQACRRAEFELRTGVKIEDAISVFLDDELFNTAPALPAPAGEPSTIRE